MLTEDRTEKPDINAPAFPQNRGPSAPMDD
jgi:hypothetical protein